MQILCLTPGIFKAAWLTPGMLAGAVFSMLLAAAPAQTNYQQILCFGASTSGSSPRGQLIEASDGYLYGTTCGGSDNSGIIFRIARDGSGFAQLHTFTNADLPYGGVMEAADGSLVGTTSGGGDTGAGTVFKCRKDGSNFVYLHVFGSTSEDGVLPMCSLVQGTNGVVYGTTSGGGTGGKGTIFSLGLDGAEYKILHHFTGPTDGADGSHPFAGLFKAADGMLYGTTYVGGSNDCGTVFRTTLSGGGYEVLHHFAGAPNDGRTVYGSLVADSQGFLWGTTYYGGSADRGTIFKMAPDGSNCTVVRSFEADADGLQPFAGLALGGNNILYGTTRYGGVRDGGTAFAMNTDGTGYAVLHRFGDLSGDGSQPLSPLLVGSDAAVYGSTYWGGARSLTPANGSLFRLLSTEPGVLITQLTPSGNGFLISFSGGAAGKTYQIQAVSDHSGSPWETIGSSTGAVDGTFQFLDLTVTNAPSRFYRSACESSSGS